MLRGIGVDLGALRAAEMRSIHNCLLRWRWGPEVAPEDWPPGLEKTASDLVPLKRKITSLFSKILWFNLASYKANQK